MIVNNYNSLTAKQDSTGPYLTYLNESEVDENGYITISFWKLENSPNNAPEDYYITEEMVGLELVFNSTLNENNNQEWTNRLTIRGKKIKVIQMVMTY